MKATKIKNTILLNRSLYNWDFYKDTNTFKLFIHLLLRASWKDEPNKLIPLKRGQLLTSLNNLSYETGLSLTSTRTSITKLTLTGSITSKSTNKYRIITVLKYNEYQLNSKQTSKPKTGKLTGKPTPSNQLNQLNQLNKTYYENAKLNEIFIDYLKEREPMKKVVNSERAINGLINKLKKYNDDVKIEMLNNAIIGGWSSVYEIKGNGYSTNKQDDNYNDDSLDKALGINGYERGHNG